jgi:hypothetical protein
MTIQFLKSVILFILLSGCQSQPQKPNAQRNDPLTFSRPKEGFLWILGMKQGSDPKPAETLYLSTGTFQKKVGSFQCVVQIQPEELNAKDFLLKQKASLDCGEKKLALTCETKQQGEPVQMVIDRDTDSMAAIFGCDNGQNEIPPREIFPGTLILSSAVLHSIADKDSVEPRTIFAYRPNENYSWIALAKSDRKILRTRIELTYETAPQQWPGFPKGTVFTNEGKTASYERTFKSENGIFYLGELYHVAEGDPGGHLQIRVFVEEHLADEFWLRFLTNSKF